MEAEEPVRGWVHCKRLWSGAGGLGLFGPGVCGPFTGLPAAGAQAAFSPAAAAAAGASVTVGFAIDVVLVLVLAEEGLGGRGPLRGASDGEWRGGAHLAEGGHRVGLSEGLAVGPDGLRCSLGGFSSLGVLWGEPGRYGRHLLHGSLFQM